MPNAVTMLKEDHKKVKGLFEEFEKATSKRKLGICKETLLELKVHTTLEEELFYPAVEKAVKDEKMMAEAEEEHHVAETIMAELEACTEMDVQFEAKYTVLAENVQHHINEEETEMLPKAEKLGKEKLDQLGEQMMMRKEELMAQMQKGGPKH